MPIFDTKRCRKWFAKERRTLGHETLESLVAERDERLRSAALTTQCVTFRMLVGEDPVTDEVHETNQCVFCCNLLRYFYLLYATKKEMAPYMKTIARANDMAVAVASRAITSSAFRDRIECFDAMDAANIEHLSRERKKHILDCVRCNLRVELWNAMNDIELRR